MRKAAWMIAALVAVLALAGEACKKKQTEQTPTAPQAAQPTTPEKAAVPTPPPTTPEPPKTPATPPATPAAEAGKTDVKGNVKGADIALSIAYARITNSGKGIVLSILDKPIPQDAFTCDGIDSPGEGYKYITAELEPGPKGDLFQGVAYPKDFSTVEFGETEWSPGYSDSMVEVTRLDLAAKILEGRIVIENKEEGEAGRLEGTFSATICAGSGEELKIEPFGTEIPTTPLAWKIGEKAVTFNSGYVTQVKDADGRPEYDLYLSDAAVSCDSQSPADQDRVLKLSVYSLPDGTFTTGKAYPLWTGYLLFPQADGGWAANESLGHPFSGYELLIQVSQIGTGDGAKLSGGLSFTKTMSGNNDAGTSVEVTATGGGTFEIPICPAAG